MYCNKCGKEIADGVSFCTNCGGKVDASNNAVIHKEFVMACSKCGKVAEGGMKYCTNCGGEIMRTERAVERKLVTSTVSGVATTLNGAAKNFVGLISLALMVILAVVYFVAAIKSFEGNRDAFEWTSDECKTLGLLFHWGICAVFAIDVIHCVLRVTSSGIKGKHLVGTSISLMITTFTIWICSMIWNEVEFEDLSIVLYRIFGTYGQLTSTSFVILIIALICGVLCFKAEQE